MASARSLSMHPFSYKNAFGLGESVLLDHLQELYFRYLCLGKLGLRSLFFLVRLI